MKPRFCGWRPDRDNDSMSRCNANWPPLAPWNRCFRRCTSAFLTAAEPVRQFRPAHVFFLFAIASFLNAALLFLIEPMVAKMILPLLGGTPNVWNTSLFCFQAMLVCGYAYAHFASRWIGIRRHAMVHLGLVSLGALALPVAINSSAMI